MLIDRFYFTLHQNGVMCCNIGVYASVVSALTLHYTTLHSIYEVDYLRIFSRNGTILP